MDTIIIVDFAGGKRTICGPYTTVYFKCINQTIPAVTEPTITYTAVDEYENTSEVTVSLAHSIESYEGPTQAQIDLEELRQEKVAKYANIDGITATIKADDKNSCVKLKWFNSYGLQIGEQEFSYFNCENPVKSAKKYLEKLYHNIFRQA